VLYYMLQCSSCHNLFFAPWQSSLCCGKALFAMAKLFVPQQSFLLQQSSFCCSKALCAMAKLFMPWQQNDAPWHSMASFFVLQLMSWQEMTCRSIARHTICCCIPCMSHHAAPLFFVPWPSLSCCSMFLCAMARNNTPQHSVPLFFVPQQETMHVP